ncbi:hypothetical protein [Sphingobacterium spiritivorum]|uniref:hypothetical protein n=1 Tax=Sphingobacterium spiritivorum TaxID=258 RepID=UPI003DA22839
MINNEDKNKQGKTDEEKDNLADNLSYNTEKDSYELDVDDDDPDYDHPADYDTLAEGGKMMILPMMTPIPLSGKNMQMKMTWKQTIGKRKVCMRLMRNISEYPAKIRSSPVQPKT